MGYVIRLRPNADNGYEGATEILRGGYTVEAATSIAQGISASGRWWASVMPADDAVRAVAANEAIWSG